MTSECLERKKEKQEIVRRFRRWLLIEKMVSILFFLLAVVTFSQFEDSVPIALFAIIIVSYFSCRIVTQVTKETLHAQQRLTATIVQGEVWEAYQDWKSENPATRDITKGKRLLKKLIRATQREHKLRKLEDSAGLIPLFQKQLATL